MQDNTSPAKSGYSFGILAALPGAMIAGAYALGTPVMSGLAAAAASVTAVASALIAVSVAGAFVSGIGGAIQIALSACMGAVVAGPLGAIITAGVAGLAGVVGFSSNKHKTSNISEKYSPKKVFIGIAGGSLLSAALTYGTVANTPQEQFPKTSTPPSLLKTEIQTNSLSHDFKLTRNEPSTNIDTKAANEHSPIALYSYKLSL